MAFAGPGARQCGRGDEPGESIVPVGFGGARFGRVVPGGSRAGPAGQVREAGHQLPAGEHLIEGLAAGEPVHQVPQGPGEDTGLVDAGRDSQPHPLPALVLIDDDALQLAQTLVQIPEGLQGGGEHIALSGAVE